jgi:hypothetical protein
MNPDTPAESTVGNETVYIGGKKQRGMPLGERGRDSDLVV